MRSLILLALLVSPRLVRAQAAGPVSDGQWLLDVTRYYTTSLGLQDLATASQRGIRHELRIWTGFGLSGTALLILTETAKGWTGTDYYPVGWKRKPERHRIPADSSESLWRAAVDAGMLDLPVEAPRSPLTSGNDGFSVLIEWADPIRTGTSAASHPDHHCTPEDLRILAVTHALVGPDAPQCVKQ